MSAGDMRRRTYIALPSVIVRADARSDTRYPRGECHQQPADQQEHERKTSQPVTSPIYAVAAQIKCRS